MSLFKACLYKYNLVIQIGNIHLYVHWGSIKRKLYLKACHQNPWSIYKHLGKWILMLIVFKLLVSQVHVLLHLFLRIFFLQKHSAKKILWTVNFLFLYKIYQIISFASTRAFTFISTHIFFTKTLREKNLMNCEFHFLYKINLISCTLRNDTQSKGLTLDCFLYHI